MVLKADVVKVTSQSRNSNDGLRNGAIIGAVAGGAVGLIVPQFTEGDNNAGNVALSTALFAAVSSAFTLRGNVEGVANDVAFVEASREGTIGVRTGTRLPSVLLHTCVIAEKAGKIQRESSVSALWRTINNSSLRKHPISS